MENEPSKSLAPLNQSWYNFQINNLYHIFFQTLFDVQHLKSWFSD